MASCLGLRPRPPSAREERLYWCVVRRLRSEGLGPGRWVSEERRVESGRPLWGRGVRVQWVSPGRGRGPTTSGAAAARSDFNRKRRAPSLGAKT